MMSAQRAEAALTVVEEAERAAAAPAGDWLGAGKGEARRGLGRLGGISIKSDLCAHTARTSQQHSYYLL